MRRRYSSKAFQTCYYCHQDFQADDDIDLIYIYDYNTNQFTHKFICQDCFDNHFEECYRHFGERLYLNTDSAYQLNNNYYCPQCKEQYIEQCENCGQDIDIKDDDTYQQSGDYYCQYCYHENFVTCEDCGCVVEQDDAVQTYDRDDNLICVCKDCSDKWIYQCQDCGQQINRFHDFYQEDVDGRVICQDCFQDHYFICDECGSIYHTDCYNTDGSCSYCNQCWRSIGGRQVMHRHQIDPQKQHLNVQFDYGTSIKPKLKKRLNQQQTKQYIGVQLQLNNANDDIQETTNFIEQVSENRKLICKEDGSLNENCGVQINTFPCTYNYHLKSFGWQHVFQIINEYHMTNTDECGLHFHISKNNFTTDEQKALDYFVNNCVSTLGAIGGRDYSNEGYCKAVPNKRQDQWGYNSDRYQAVNFNNFNTVELRFPKATSNYNTFKKRLRMVHNICKLAKFFSFDDLKHAEEKDLSYLFGEIIKQL